MASRGDQHQQRQQPQRSQQAPFPPSQEQQQKGRGKPRSYSIQSHKTHRSSGSKHEFHETHEEKEAKRLHSKADPTLAMNEAEPSMVAAMKSERTQVSLRSMRHKDAWGNPIADPDKSNPTRNRWERPLDTIRSFEAAIDGGYQHTDSVANWNRRSSVQPASQPRFPQDSFYNSRPVSYRQGDGQYGVHTPGTARNSVYDNPNAGGGFSGSGYERGYGVSRHASRDRSQRMQSEAHFQMYGREQGVYPMPHKDRSYETVTSAAPSGNSDPAGYQTDPTSSDNSSIDRISPAKRSEPVNDYGIGFSQTQAYDVQNPSVGKQAKHHVLPLPPPSRTQPQAAPPPQAVARKPSLLRRQTSPEEDGNTDNRKSWFSRHFSKKG
ncbi:uncharacterized protein MAM_03619 [Metarhizium album ARSEF 1941]|uniref:DUF2406 domain protein n=1 Tax=Metarhizium album (strain ARSEF 1941) TaxID=1081103 RepID=A0A0B2X079_METAS|nr:uncharacterized protein MAM_03619 [Metarhizium album ARSEF 1941]KHN98495.1 hypothetical protein MAM_03619 [Metarhizium album ARSEF 1941]